MGTYVMLTKVSPEALTKRDSVTRLNRRLEYRMKKECPGVYWIANHAVLGPCDYLDIFKAPNTDTATKVVALLWSRNAGDLGRNDVGAVLKLGPQSKRLGAPRAGN